MNLDTIRNMLNKTSIDYETFKSYYNYLISKCILTSDIKPLLPYFLDLKYASILLTDKEIPSYRKHLFIIDNLCISWFKELMPRREEIIKNVKEMINDLRCNYIEFSLFKDYFYTLELYSFSSYIDISSLIKIFLDAFVVTNSYEEEKRYFLITNKLNNMLNDLNQKRLVRKNKWDT